MKKASKIAAFTLALSLCASGALAQTDNLDNFTKDIAGQATRKVIAVLDNREDIETANAYSAEIVWGDMQFAWGTYGGQAQVWDPVTHQMKDNTEGVQQGWYLVNDSKITGDGADVVGNPDHSHVLVFNHSCYGIQVSATMQDSNLNDNVTPLLNLSPEYGVGLNTERYDHARGYGSDDYKLFMDAGTLNTPYDNGVESEKYNCAVFQLQLSTPDNVMPENLDNTLGIADVSISIQPLGN